MVSGDFESVFLGFEGGDGSGKGTQFDLACKRLRSDNHLVTELDFPRYSDPMALGVKKYLNGEYGHIDGYQASVLYAVDRFDAFFYTHEGKQLINTWREQGGFMLTNRYTTSNMGHQAGKAETVEDREKIIRFIEYLEYEVMGLPRPNDVFLLDVDPFVAQRLVDMKGKRQYTDKKRDLHENDLTHLQNASESYLYVAQRENWTVVDCMIPGYDREAPINQCLRPIEDIHEEIFTSIENRFL